MMSTQAGDNPPRTGDIEKIHKYPPSDGGAGSPGQSGRYPHRRLIDAMHEAGLVTDVSWVSVFFLLLGAEQTQRAHRASDANDSKDMPF
jgi:hypothetical protein